VTSLRSTDGPTQCGLFDIESHARPGPARRGLSPQALARVRAVVGGAPEVFVKGRTAASSRRAVVEHVEYVTRDGDLPLELDEGDAIRGPDVGQQLVREWNLDLSAGEFLPAAHRGVRSGAPARLYVLTFSAPAGVEPTIVRAAARATTARIAGEHQRWATVLHTDRPHPHVHAVLKAESEEGRRRNVTREEYLHWRGFFAEELRARGVDAVASHRRSRGLTGRPIPTRLDAIAREGRSRALRARAHGVVAELARGGLAPEPGRARLLATRAEVVRGWRAVSAVLRRQGEAALADDVDRFVASFPPVRTDREALAEELLRRARAAKATASTRAEPTPVRAAHPPRTR
jgi:hypothetical protein